MTHVVDVNIGVKHGDLERPNAVKEPFEPPTIGRLIIEWPAPSPHGIPLHNHGMRAYDYDSGAELVSATGIRIDLGGTNWNGETITAELTTLVNADGQPLRDGEPVHPVFVDDVGVATGVFRYEVMEMRVATPKGSIRG